MHHVEPAPSRPRMWLDIPTLSLRQQILEDFAAHRTPSGCVKARQRAKRVAHTNGEKVAAKPSEPEAKS